MDSRFDHPPDYKFFVFSGQVKLIQVDLDRFTNHTRVLFDSEWNKLPVKYKYPIGESIRKPKNLKDMVSLAETLGDEFEFVRVDLYEIDQQRIVFGEMIFAPESGYGRFLPSEFDFKLGSHW